MKRKLDSDIEALETTLRNYKYQRSRLDMVEDEGQPVPKGLLA